MDDLILMLTTGEPVMLDARFICGIFVLSVILEFISVFVAHCSALGGR